MGDLYLAFCLIYLDDVIIYSSSYEEHLKRLDMVFEQLVEAGLKLKPSKCNLFQKKIKCLGHIVSEDGVETDPDKIEVVKNWPVPKSVKDVRRFLGFVGYYRRFIKGFARIARPLHDLLQDSGGPKRKKSKIGSFVWGATQQVAFEQLVEACCSAPILGFADFSSPFHLHTDASLDGLGAVLYQTQDGYDRVISYASRSLSKSEKNYPAHKLEFLALKWAVTEKFRDYLYGQAFEVRTDNNPLTYILTSAKLDATGHRWVAELAQFNFSLVYRSGRLNGDADALSRMHAAEALKGAAPNQEVEAETTITSQTIAAVFSGEVPALGAVEAFALSTNVLSEFPDVLADSGTIPKDWAVLQRQDSVLKDVIGVLEETYENLHFPVPEAKALMRLKDSLVLRNNILYRKRQVEEEVLYQLVLPKQYRKEAFVACHDRMGHLGRERSLDLLRSRVYWPGMSTFVAEQVNKCDRCLRRKTPINQRAPLVNISTTQPLETICIDYLTLEDGKGGVGNVLVITDHYTRYAQAFPTPNQTASTTAKVLYNNLLVHYGFPRRIHSDQGRNFESAIIKQLCDLIQSAKSRTTPYHPSGNGQCERFNRTLLNMLGTLVPAQKADWKKFVSSLVHAYNCTKHDSTGYSPFYLMFGRHPRIPVDLIVGSGHQGDKGQESYGQFVSSLRSRMEYAFNLANTKIAEAQRKQKH
jgi:transposase InsO family protein